MPDLTPMTRQEKFLNGDTDLEPITRREHFYAGRESELPEGHQEPETREEWFIKEYREAGDVTVEEITITENGTTTAPSGKAYSPIHTNVPQPTLSTLEVSENGDYDAPSGTAYNRVEVNVPLPTNAYLLKSVANLPQAIASFNDGEEMVMPSLKVAIEPQQDLHGYDSPWAGGAGKNKFDISKVVTNAEVVNNGTSLSLTTNPQTNNCTAGTPNKLKDYCPTLKEGDTVTFSFESTGDRKYIYLLGYNDQWNSGTSKVITDAMLNSTVLWYTSQGVSTATVSKIQFELGSSATSYAPYSNICPISGWDEADVTRAGKNLFDIDSPHEAGSGSATYTYTVRVKPNTAYTMSSNVPQDNPASLYFNGGATNVNGVWNGTPRTFTSDANGNFVVYVRYSTTQGGIDLYTAVKNGTYWIQLEEGSTVTTYEPYAGTTYTIDLDGTRYGGTLDVVSGVLTVDRVSVTITGNDLQSVAAASSGINYATFPLQGAGKDNLNKLCNMYVATTSPSFDNSIRTVNLSGYIYDNRFTDLATARALINETNVQVVYELANPITYQLTSTQVKSLLGSNNVWADTGDITDAEYFSKEV